MLIAMLIAFPCSPFCHQAFAREVVSELLHLHTRTSHIVYSISISGGPSFSPSQLWTPGAAPGPAGSPTKSRPPDGSPPPQAPSGGTVWPSLYDAGGTAFGHSVSHSCLERVREELAEAALRLPPGRPVAAVQLYGAGGGREAPSYVPIRRHLLFQHRKASVA